MTAPLTQKPIRFINECGAILRELDLESAMIWWANDRTMLSKKKVYLHGKYPGVSILNEKIHVHRLLVSYWMKRKLKRIEYVHHKNGNKLDSRRENLEIMNAGEHTSKHLTGFKKSRESILKSNSKGWCIRLKNLKDMGYPPCPVSGCQNVCSKKDYVNKDGIIKYDEKCQSHLKGIKPKLMK